MKDMRVRIQQFFAVRRFSLAIVYRFSLILCLAIQGNVLAEESDSLLQELSRAGATLDSIRILNQLSNAYQATTPEKSLNASELALQMSRRIDDSYWVAISLYRLGQYYHQGGEHDRAVIAYQEALQALDPVRFPRETADIFDYLGRVYTDMAQNRPLAIEAAKNALSIFESLHDTSSASRISNQIGYRFWRLARHDSALTYFSRARDYRKTLPDRHALAQTTNNMGVVYYNTGNYEQALEYYFEAMALQIEAGNQYSTSLLLTNIGKAYLDWGRYEEAEAHFREALKAGYLSTRDVAIAYALNNLGLFHHEAARYDSAADYFAASLEAYARAKHTEGKILNLNHMGPNYLKLGNMDKALKSLARARALSDSVGFPFGLATAMKNFGDTYTAMGDYPQALEHYRQGLRLSLSTDRSDLTRDIYSGLAAAFEKHGSLDSALFYFKLFEVMDDSLYSDQTARNINALKVHYDSEKKTRENAALRIQDEQQETIIKRTRTLMLVLIAVLIISIFVSITFYRLYRSRHKLSQQLKESESRYRRLSEELAESDSVRELLLDIITHDLKNPAGVIRSLAELAIEENPNNEIVRTIRESSQRLLSVLDETSTLSRAAFGETIPKSELDLQTVFQEILEEFQPLLRREEMELDVHIPEGISIHANPLIAEVFKNYISNAIKYAHEGRKIIVQASLEAETLEVRVIDFGSTIAEKDRLAVFERSVQLDSGKKLGRGLGLAIVKRIALAHGGEAWVEANQPQGNQFCIRMPIH